MANSPAMIACAAADPSGMASASWMVMNRKTMANKAKTIVGNTSVMIRMAFAARSMVSDRALIVLSQLDADGPRRHIRIVVFAIAKKRQLVPVSKETLDALIVEVENKLPAPED